MPSIPYSIRRSARARHLRLTAHADGAITVTAPLFLREREIMRFVDAHQDWIARKQAAFHRFASKTPIGEGAVGFEKYKHAAADLVQRRLAHFNAHYDFPLKKVLIKNQKTRWGSCSQKGTLCFNYRIALLPSHLADYLIVHELCHVKAFNHSPTFWRLVGETIPDHREMRKELRALRIV